MTGRLLTPTQVADILQISRKTLWQHVHDGSITYVKVGAGEIRPRIAFDQDDVDKFIASRKVRNSVPAAQSIGSASQHGFMALRAQRQDAALAAANMLIDRLSKKPNRK